MCFGNIWSIWQLPHVKWTRALTVKFLISWLSQHYHHPHHHYWYHHYHHHDGQCPTRWYHHHHKYHHHQVGTWLSPSSAISSPPSPPGGTWTWLGPSYRWWPTRRWWKGWPAVARSWWPSIFTIMLTIIVVIIMLHCQYYNYQDSITSNISILVHLTNKCHIFATFTAYGHFCSVFCFGQKTNYSRRGRGKSLGRVGQQFNSRHFRGGARWGGQSWKFLGPGRSGVAIFPAAGAGRGVHPWLLDTTVLVSYHNSQVIS